MHQAVCDAKAAGCQALRSGTTGEEVHLATTAIIEENGFSLIRGDHQHDLSLPAMRHGTGHGIGLEIHEPILLDHGGGIILENEIFTVEPGLYSSTLGGVRVEDMALVTKDGHEILSPLYEGLDWSD
jgi:Xaa-Pro aminopeptidase